MSSLLQNAHRIVVKVGSALVTNDGRGLDESAIERWAGQIAELRRMGREVILVSSGAVAEGVLRLGWEKRPQRVYEKQAAAAVGQMGLVQAYETHFRAYGIRTALVLLTHANLVDREQYLNARMTLNELLRLGIVPVINENDTVVTSEIKVGDNDTLGAIVARCVKADLLVLLSDIEGLYTADPRKDPSAKLIPVVEEVTPEIEALAGGVGSGLATGGMATKLRAAKMVAEVGCDMIITNGEHPEVLYDIAEGKAVGTRFIGKK